jgi:hypothetical protein
MSISSQTEVNKISSPYTILLQTLFVQAVFVAALILLILAVASFTKQWQHAFLGFLGVYLGGYILASFVGDITRERGWFYTNVVHNFANFGQAVWNVPSTPPGALPSVLIIAVLLVAGFGVFAWRILHLEVAE